MNLSFVFKTTFHQLESFVNVVILVSTGKFVINFLEILNYRLDRN